MRWFPIFGLIWVYCFLSLFIMCRLKKSPSWFSIFFFIIEVFLFHMIENGHWLINHVSWLSWGSIRDVSTQSIWFLLKIHKCLWIQHSVAVDPRPFLQVGIHRVEFRALYVSTIVSEGTSTDSVAVSLRWIKNLKIMNSNLSRESV